MAFIVDQGSEDEGSVASEATENSHNHAPSASHEDSSDNESEDWILDEIQRQIDEQLQADIEKNLDEQLWKEMDEQLEQQMDEHIQNELNQQLNELLSKPNDHLSNDFSEVEGNGDFQLQRTASMKTSIESVNEQQGASVCSINAQIQKIVHQYEGLNLEAMK